LEDTFVARLIADQGTSRSLRIEITESFVASAPVALSCVLLNAVSGCLRIHVSADGLGNGGSTPILIALLVHTSQTLIELLALTSSPGGLEIAWLADTAFELLVADAIVFRAVVAVAHDIWIKAVQLLGLATLASLGEDAVTGDGLLVPRSARTGVASNRVGADCVVTFPAEGHDGVQALIVVDALGGSEEADVGADVSRLASAGVFTIDGITVLADTSVCS